MFTVAQHYQIREHIRCKSISRISFYLYICFVINLYLMLYLMSNIGGDFQALPTPSSHVSSGSIDPKLVLVPRTNPGFSTMITDLRPNSFLLMSRPSLWISSGGLRFFLFHNLREYPSNSCHSHRQVVRSDDYSNSYFQIPSPPLYACPAPASS